LPVTGVGAGAGGAEGDGLGLGLAPDGVVPVGVGEPLGVVVGGVVLGEPLGVVLGEPLGVVVGEPLGVAVGEPLGCGLAAGQVCDKLNHCTCVLPAVVSTLAEALSRTAPGAEATYACLSLGGPNVVIVWVPPGLNVTVRETKTVSLPGRTKAHPSWVLGILAHCASWPLKPAAVIGGVWCSGTVYCAAAVLIPAAAIARPPPATATPAIRTILALFFMFST
jgi:hypothetical protein